MTLPYIVRQLDAQTDVTGKLETYTNGTLTSTSLFPFKRGTNKTIGSCRSVGWRKALRSGEVVMNPHFVSSETRTSGGGSWGGDAAPYKQVWYYTGDFASTALASHYAVPLPPAAVPLIDTVAIAKSKALASLEGELARLGEDVIMCRQTLNSLVKPLEGLREIQKDMQQHRLLYGASSAWLKYRMEWTPLWHSAVDLIRILRDPLARITGGQKVRLTGVSVDSGACSESKIVSPASATVTRYKYSSSRAVILGHFLADENISVLRALGLSERDVPGAIWATVPWSFMIDRMLNLSRALEGVKTLTNRNFVIDGACVTTKVLERSTLISSVWSTNWPRWSSCGEDCTETFTLQRVPWAPGAMDTLPRLDCRGLVSKAERVGDLAALLGARMRAFQAGRLGYLPTK